ncbi:MAG: hypothetical protein RLZZ308_558 [Candidatus Parcubacteria bacterium]|jgi:hypothetical protein
MADQRKTTTFVAGFVRVQEGKDGNLSFKILKQWFRVPKDSTYAKRVREARRLLVRFEPQEGRKSPKILSIIKDPTYKEIRDHVDNEE